MYMYIYVVLLVNLCSSVQITQESEIAHPSMVSTIGLFSFLVICSDMSCECSSGCRGGLVVGSGCALEPAAGYLRGLMFIWLQGLV